MDNNLIRVIQIGVPILLILLTAFDFAKVVFVDDKEGIQNAFKRFTKRAIAAILIFLTPTILILIATVIGTDPSVSDCMKTLNNSVENQSNK